MVSKFIVVYSENLLKPSERNFELCNFKSSGACP